MRNENKPKLNQIHRIKFMTTTKQQQKSIQIQDFQSSALKKTHNSVYIKYMLLKL